MAGAASIFAGSPSAEGEIHYFGIIDLRFLGDHDKSQKEPLADGALKFTRVVDVGGSDRVGIYSATGEGGGGNLFSSRNLDGGEIVSEGPFIDATSYSPILASVSNQGNFLAPQ